MIFPDDGGGYQSHYRRYQNVAIPPYQMTTGTRAHFEFANTYGDDIQLSWRLTNQRYHHVLLYSQHFSPRPWIQRSLDIPAFLFDGGPTTLHLIATRPNFHVQISIVIYPHTHYVVRAFQQPYLAPISLSRIDQDGFIRYEREQFAFDSMNLHQIYPTYGRFDLSLMQIRFLHQEYHQPIIESARLLIANQVGLEGLRLNASLQREIPVHAFMSQRTMRFHFPTLFVHPRTLMPSATPQTHYVPTTALFFPIAQFARLKYQSMRLMVTFRHIHTFTIDYPFHYVGERAIIGPCHQSGTCVTLYD